MTPDQRDEVPAVGAARLDEAAAHLRSSVPQRWVQVADRVLSRALAVSRRSAPVLAMAPGGPVRIGEQVIVAYLRAAVDAEVADAAVQRIVLDIGDDERLAGVVIEIVARYGVALLPLADAVRLIAARELLDLIGVPTTAIDVRSGHVHVTDVVRGDPHLRTPFDD